MSEQQHLRLTCVRNVRGRTERFIFRFIVLLEIRPGSELSERHCRRSTGHSTFARFGIKLYSTGCFDYSSYSSCVTNQTECQVTNCFYTDIRTLLGVTNVRPTLSFFHEFYPEIFKLCRGPFYQSFIFLNIINNATRYKESKQNWRNNYRYVLDVG